MEFPARFGALGQADEGHDLRVFGRALGFVEQTFQHAASQGLGQIQKTRQCKAKAGQGLVVRAVRTFRALR